MLDEPLLRGDLLLDVDRILCKISSDAGAVLLLLRIEYLDEEVDEEVALDICSLVIVFAHVFSINNRMGHEREWPNEKGAKSRKSSKHP